MAKKRANGEGSIRKKPSGRWEGRYTQGIDPVTGRAIQKSVSAKTQAECKEKLAKAIRENRGVPLNHTGDYTAAEWCRLWFETYSKPNIRYNTAKGYEGIIEHHIIPAIGAIKLKQLSSIHIQRMYNDLKENGRMPRGSKQNGKALSNTFVRRVHAVLQAALKQAVKERLIPYNPCENCRIPPKDKKEMTILPPEKIGRYLQEAEKYGVLPMFYLELSSGLRRGELLALQWEDLNVKERILTVNKQVTRMEGELDVIEPKTKNSVRKVALSQQAVDLLVQEHEQHPDNPILFPSPRTGGYWSPDAVSRINRKLLKNAGIEEHVRFHDLRHTFATMAISSGVDVKTLSSMLGHYSAGFTLDIYTHITNDMQRGAAEKIGGFMESVTATVTPEGRKSSKCNKNLTRSFPTEALSRAVVQKINDHVQLRLRQRAKIIALREEKPQQSVCVLVSAALPGLVRLGEVHGRPDMFFKKTEFRELRAVVQRNASHRMA